MRRLFEGRYLSYWVVLFIDIVVALLSSMIAIVLVRYFAGVTAISKSLIAWMLVVSMVVNTLCFYIFHS